MSLLQRSCRPFSTTAGSSGFCRSGLQTAIVNRKTTYNVENTLVKKMFNYARIALIMLLALASTAIAADTWREPELVVAYTSDIQGHLETVG